MDFAARRSAASGGGVVWGEISMTAEGSRRRRDRQRAHSVLTLSRRGPDAMLALDAERGRKRHASHHRTRFNRGRRRAPAERACPPIAVEATWTDRRAAARSRNAYGLLIRLRK